MNSDYYQKYDLTPLFKEDIPPFKTIILIVFIQLFNQLTHSSIPLNEQPYFKERENETRIKAILLKFIPPKYSAIECLK